MLIIGTIQPNALVIVDKNTDSVYSVSLNKEPLSVSVSLDGQRAAIGHDGAVSYVDINQHSLLFYEVVPCKAGDVVLGNNNYIYAFPSDGQWTDIVCFSINTRSVTYHTGNSVRQGTKAKLSPLGQAIYGADNGLSPSDIEKYNISGGTATYLYDSPYHGDYPFGGDLWINESGTRLISKARTILQLTESPGLDLTYAGTLSGRSGMSSYQDLLIHADHSNGANKLFTIFSNGEYSHSTKFGPDSLLRIYDGTYFGFVENRLIPYVKQAGECFRSEIHYGYFNDSGTEYYMIMKVSSVENPNKIMWTVSTMEV